MIFFYTVQTLRFNSALATPGEQGVSAFPVACLSSEMSKLPLSVSSGKASMVLTVSCAVENEPTSAEDFRKQSEQMEIIFSHY